MWSQLPRIPFDGISEVTQNNNLTIQQYSGKLHLYKKEVYGCRSFDKAIVCVTEAGF
jgi:hypothetical protein